MPLTSNSSTSPHNPRAAVKASAQQQQILQQAETSTATNEKVRKLAAPHLFDIGKKEDHHTMDGQSETSKLSRAAAQNISIQPTSQERQQSGSRRHPPPAPLSPSRLAYQPSVASSPSRLRSNSPRLHNPGNSEIFERNVQEPISISNLHGELNPAHIPAHVITEDSIPPALEASALTITSSSLDPDEVEIVTSSSHQPAASGIEGSTSHSDLTPLESPLLTHRNKSEETAHSFLQHSGTFPGIEDESASSYGQLDPNDVRRLSFISFSDIVQSEQHQMAASALGDVGSRDSLHLHHDGTASPVRVPRSPTTTYDRSINGLTTPPAVSGAVNINSIPGTAEQSSSPTQSIKLGSPSGQQHGDLNIETMRQALRKTASGDLSGGRSAATMSPASDATSLG
ncbi:uncharacterized protein RCC_07024 [Ramularia collo-cygni]|uniref:Uncharacterized protein n=1 Tax=Ramularia collo-cygni TaxID=112498 RepID=A0A2D3VJP0_9PEZI|nr:uncharacterized protein RCC_07024 [Ramularia collo-cygni]CZT21163.1 uncharacterized protein RCC_07024 [Ramularia collo-cygni]